MVTALALLLFSVLTGGGCLAGYIVLLSNETPHWLPAVGRMDVLQAFLSVLAATCTAQEFLLGHRVSIPDRFLS
uniref:Uncharacterized protein n=1 Tax=Oryza rufipogon TaxID=4529 RepID=A0A0E0QHW6_ORYRU